MTEEDDQPLKLTDFHHHESQANRSEINHEPRRACLADSLPQRQWRNDSNAAQAEDDPERSPQNLDGL